MADPRQRKSQVLNNSDVQDLASSQDTKQEGSTVRADSSESPAPTSNRTSARPINVLLGAVLIAAVAFYISLQKEGGSGIASYALCSRQGRRIYTVDEHDTKVQCLVVHGKDIVATGDLAEVKRKWRQSSSNAKSKFIRYIPNGSIVIPGMSDSHAHILEYATSKQLPLGGTKSVEDTVTAVRNHVLGNIDIFNDKDAFIFGDGWDQTLWPSGNWPTTADLEKDVILRGRRIVLQSKDYHALWVSQAVLDSTTELPNQIDGGVIPRNSNGEPTGIFLDSAQKFINIPGPTEKELVKQLESTAQDALSKGLTMIHDAGFKPRSLEFFKRRANANKLPIRIYGMTHFNETEEYWGDSRQIIIGAGNGRLSARSVKIFADGALRTGGAALYEPYSDNTETTGFMRLPLEVLNDVIPRFLRDGWQVNVHAIGDRANGIVLDAFELASKSVDVKSLRPRLEHAQMLAQKDLARLGKLGVIASVQPTHVTSDMWYAEERLGPERVKMLYPFRSILDSGARIALGSDFPVEDMNPLAGMYAATTRVGTNKKSPHGPSGWFPEQKLTRTECLRGLTIDAAYASFSEDLIGSLEKGKRADFVVLSRDIISISASELLRTRVIATALDGEVVYGKI